MILLALLACLPVPSPDLRRPAALVVLDGIEPAGVSVRVCTWSTRHPPMEGCENLGEGIAAVDGVGVREWSTFPLVLRGKSPAWADIFAACRDGQLLGAAIRLPGIAPKWDEVVHVKPGAPTKTGVSSVADIDDPTAKALGEAVCAGTIPVKDY